MIQSLIIYFMLGLAIGEVGNKKPGIRSVLGDTAILMDISFPKVFLMELVESLLSCTQKNNF